MRYTQLLATFAIVSAGFFQSDGLDALKQKVIANNPFTTTGEVSTDAFDLWSPEELHQWLSYHKLDPPEVGDSGALLNLARHNKEKLLSDLQHAAEEMKPTEGILDKGAEYYQQVSDSFFNTWSDSALVSYLSDRGEDIKSIADHEKLVELANKYKGVAIDTKNKVTRGWFDSWSSNDLKVTLQELGIKAEGTRKQLADQLYETYVSAKNTASKQQAQGEKNAQQALKSIEKWRKDTFDSWSIEDLKDYVGQFSPNPPSKKDQLVKAARSEWNYFVYGKAVPQTTSSPWGKISGYANCVSSHLSSIAGGVRNRIFAIKDEL